MADKKKKPVGFKDFINVDYTKTGDDQRMINAKKRKRDSGEGTTESVEQRVTEALDMAARRKRAISLRKNKAKIKRGRERAKRKVANMDTLKKRARRQARTQVSKKLTKGVDKSDLSFGRRQEIEKRLGKMSSRIKRIARKLLPQVRKQELARKRGSKNKEREGVSNKIEKNSK